MSKIIFSKKIKFITGLFLCALFFLGVQNVANAADDNYLLSNSGNMTIQKGSSAVNIISSELVSGTLGKVSLSSSISPAGSGISVSFSKTRLSIPDSSNLTINVPSGTPAGNYTVTVTGVTSAGGFCVANLEPTETGTPSSNYEIVCTNNDTLTINTVGGATFSQVQNLNQYINSIGDANTTCGQNKYSTTTSSLRIDYACKYLVGGTYQTSLTKTTSFVVTVTAPSNYIDIGLRVMEQGRSSPTAIAIIPSSSSENSQLRIAKNGIIYKVALVDTSDANATSERISLAGGVIKALRRF